MKAELIQVIRTESPRGDGKDDVYRIVTQYWSPEGLLLAERDPCMISMPKALTAENGAKP